MAEDKNDHNTPFQEVRSIQTDKQIAAMSPVKPSQKQELRVQLSHIDRGGQSTHSDHRK